MVSVPTASTLQPLKAATPLVTVMVSVAPLHESVPVPASDRVRDVVLSSLTTSPVASSTATDGWVVNGTPVEPEDGC